MSLPTHQVIKYVPLMDMDCDESLIFGPLHSFQVSCGHVNQRIEQVKEQLVGFSHDAAIKAGIGQSLLRVSGPNHLDTEQAHLGLG